jgi:putative hemolysin
MGPLVHWRRERPSEYHPTTVSELIGSIALVGLFILIGGMFAAAELALVTLRETQLKSMAEKSSRGAKVAKLAANPNRFLAAVQIGVTLSGFFSAAFGEATLSTHLEKVFTGWGLSAGLADVVSLIIITLIVSYFALVLGELSPKRIALQRSERIALFVAPPLDRIARLLRPVIWLLSHSTDLVVRLLGGDPNRNREAITEEELRGLVAAHETLSVDERTLIDDVFAAGERQVSEVMIHRTEVDFLEASMTVSRAAKIVADSSYSRYPVVGEGGQDDVIGFVHIRDILAPSQPEGRATTVGSLAREVKRLPGSKKVLAALSEMRREGHHVAIVLDEYGGTDGIVTLEDLIEEVIGDIRDEYDVATAPVDRTEVDGLSNLDDFGEATGLQLPDGPYETAAGFVMSALGRLPAVGDTVEVSGRRLTVLSMEGRRVARLRISPAAGSAAAAGSGPASSGDRVTPTGPGHREPDRA